MRRAIACAALACAVGAAAPAAQQPAGPSGRCDLVVTPRGDSTRMSSLKQASGVYNTFVGGGVTGACPAQGLTLTADSAEYFGDLRRWHLIGAVHYQEPRLILDSQVATYFIAEERLLAEGNVHTRLPSGTTLVGPRVEYLRAVPGLRTIARMIAPGRPTITLIGKDSAGKPETPMVLIANTVVMDADSLVYAAGRVEMTREDVFAKCDTAALDGAHEFARLMRTPVITSRGKNPFTLYGTIIDLFGGGKELHRVLAKGAGKAVSDNGTVTADTLDFQMEHGGLARMYAWGRSRARAVNPQYDIVSDSMDVRSPGQRLREIRALRAAEALSTPDTVKFRTKEKDWLRGDTIFARFDSTPATRADSAKQPTLLELVALGHARSYYKISAKDSTAIGPAISYVRGGRVAIAFRERQVRTVTVTDSVAGVYIEPTPPKRPKPDSAATPVTAAPKSATP